MDEMESPGTVRFAINGRDLSLTVVRSGDGFFRDLLMKLGRWLSDFQPPGCSPVAYLERLELLGPDLVAAHGVWKIGRAHV